MILNCSVMSTSVLLAMIFLNYIPNKTFSLQIITDRQQVEEKLNSFLRRKDNLSFERTKTWFKRLTGSFSICGLPDDEKLNLCYWSLVEEDEFDDESFTDTDCYSRSFEYEQAALNVHKKYCKISMYRCPQLLRLDPATGGKVDDDREIYISRVNWKTDQAIVYVRYLFTLTIKPLRYLREITKKDRRTRRPKPNEPRSLNRNPPNTADVGRLFYGPSQLSTPGEGSPAFVTPTDSPAHRIPRSQISSRRKRSAPSYLPIRDIWGNKNPAFHSAGTTPTHPRGSIKSRSDLVSKSFAAGDKDVSSSISFGERNIHRPYDSDPNSPAELDSPNSQAGPSTFAVQASGSRSEPPNATTSSVQRSQSDNAMESSHADDVSFSEMWPYRKDDALTRRRSSNYSDRSDHDDTSTGTKTPIEVKQALLLEKVSKHLAAEAESRKKGKNEEDEAPLIAEPDRVSPSSQKDLHKAFEKKVSLYGDDPTDLIGSTQYTDQSANRPRDIEDELFELDPDSLDQEPHVLKPLSFHEWTSPTNVGSEARKEDPLTTSEDEFSFPTNSPAPSTSSVSADTAPESLTSPTSEISKAPDVPLTESFTDNSQAGKEGQLTTSEDEFSFPTNIPAPSTSSISADTAPKSFTSPSSEISKAPDVPSAESFTDNSQAGKEDPLTTSEDEFSFPTNSPSPSTSSVSADTAPESLTSPTSEISKAPDVPST